MVSVSFSGQNPSKQNRLVGNPLLIKAGTKAVAPGRHSTGTLPYTGRAPTAGRPDLKFPAPASVKQGGFLAGGQLLHEVLHHAVFIVLMISQRFLNAEMIQEVGRGAGVFGQYRSTSFKMSIARSVMSSQDYRSAKERGRAWCTRRFDFRRVVAGQPVG